MKRKGAEIVRFFKNMKADYKSGVGASKKDKSACFRSIIGNIFLLLWGNISAPLFYPVWYMFRKGITEKIHKGTSWQEIQSLIQNNKTQQAKTILKQNGKILYWIWTYGDIDDPLNWGGMPTDYGKNTFWNRFRWSAIRNPRFNINYMELRTSTITEASVSIDTRNQHIKHYSAGFGAMLDGIILKWMKDDIGKWYFIYEEANYTNLWYLGYVGLMQQDVGKAGGRLELSYRITEKTVEE